MNLDKLDNTARNKSCGPHTPLQVVFSLLPPHTPAPRGTEFWPPPSKIVTLQPVYHTLASYLWNNYVQPKNQYDIINEP